MAPAGVRSITAESDELKRDADHDRNEVIIQFIRCVDRGPSIEPKILPVVRDILCERLPGKVRRAERDLAILALDSWLVAQKAFSLRRRARVIEDAARAIETRGTLPENFHGLDNADRGRVAELVRAALRWHVEVPDTRQLQNLLRR